MSHGKRYSAKERKEILSYLENHTYQETMEKYKVSQMSLARWVKQKENRNTNTTPPLLPIETQKEIHIYLKMLENMDNVNATETITAAGELILPENSGFHSIFTDINDITKTTSNFLLCAQGFTAAVMNEQKHKDPKFNDLSIRTPVGTFFMHSVGNRAVLVVLFKPEYDLGENFGRDSYFINNVCTQLLQVFEKSHLNN